MCDDCELDPCRCEYPYAGELDLSDNWDTWDRFTPTITGMFTGYGYARKARHDAFRDYLRTLVHDPETLDDLCFCDNCNKPIWQDDTQSAEGGSSNVCYPCYCDMEVCDYCHEHYTEVTTTLDDSAACEGCLETYYYWCESCEGYYSSNDEDNHDHDESDSGGCCASPQQAFRIRNDGHFPLANNTRTTISLPAGIIDTEGLDAIHRYLRFAYRQLSYDLASLGEKWQTREGNYVKRLSHMAYKNHRIKLSQDELSKIGSIARDHSNAVDVTIEITRDLNQSARYFYHEDSCYWGGYGASRCVLKTNGGFGLRSFDINGNIAGRAWVMPLKYVGWRLTPTFDTMTPDAYIVFNGYGDLGYTAPRLIAHLAGWTYRKIGFDCEPMYINSGGYLITSENIAAKYSDRSISLSVQQHSSLYVEEEAATLAKERNTQRVMELAFA